MLLLPLLACQLPFDEDRHDLASFRIAAVGASAGADHTIQVRAAVYSGEGAYFDAAPAFAWQVGDETADGPVATFSATYPTSVKLTVTAQGPKAATESAVLDLAAAPTPPVVAGWTRGVTDLTLADAALPIDDRAAHTPGADTPAAAGGALRLAIDAVDDGPRVTHWMGTGGQFAELDEATTDWFAGAAELDGDEVVSSTPADPGVYPLLALTFDGEGGDTWTWLDAAVGVDGPLLHVGGRLFPVDTAERGEGWWEATVQSDDSLAGIRLTDLTPGTAPAEDAAGPCQEAPGTGFDPAALAEGWCARGDLEGARVTVWGEITP